MKDLSCIGMVFIVNAACWHIQCAARALVSKGQVKHLCDQHMHLATVAAQPKKPAVYGGTAGIPKCCSV